MIFLRFFVFRIRTVEKPADESGSATRLHTVQFNLFNGGLGRNGEWKGKSNSAIAWVDIWKCTVVPKIF